MQRNTARQQGFTSSPFARESLAAYAAIEETGEVVEAAEVGALGGWRRKYSGGTQM